MVLRKDTDTHLNEVCSQKVLLCSNEDCKEEIKREDYKVHVEEKCEYRVVECEYKKFGCDVDGLRYIDIKSHMDEYKLDHMSNKFDFICSNVCSISLASILGNIKPSNFFVADCCFTQQNGIIAQLQETNKDLRAQNEELTATVNELKMSFDALESKQSAIKSKVYCVVLFGNKSFYTT